MSKEKKATNSVAAIAYVLHMAFQYNKPYVLVLWGLIVTNALLPFPIILFPRIILDSLFIHQNFATAIANVLYMSVSYVLLHFFDVWLRAQKEKHQFALKQQFMRRLSNKAISMPYAVLEDSNTVEKMNRAVSAVNGDVNWAVSRGLSGDKGLDAIGSECINISSACFRLVGIIYILSNLDIGIFAVLCLVVLINTIAGLMKKRSEYHRRTDTSKLADRAQYFRGTMFDSTYAKEIRQGNMQTYLIDRFLNCREELFSKRYAKFSGSVGAGLLSNITDSIQEFIVFLYLIQKAIFGGLSVGSFMMYVSAINTFTGSLIDMINSFLNLNLYSHFMCDYVDVINIDDNEPSGVASVQTPSASRTIEFRDVWFHYPNSQDYVLKGISIVIQSGEKLSVVGANGAGKTTFIKLILRLYKPQRGAIYLDGININDIEISSYLRTMSAVFQDYTVYPFTIQDNIAFGDAREPKLRTCIEKTHVDRLVEGLPHGLNTMLSREFDKDGMELSTGQQQRLMLARALYKDSGIVILDEPTAALDAVAEQALYHDFNALTDQKTIIYISHRMAITKFCDRIAVFDAGNIVEYGAHDALIEQDGLYCAMFRTQAHLYDEGENK